MGHQLLPHVNPEKHTRLVTKVKARQVAQGCRGRANKLVQTVCYKGDMRIRGKHKGAVGCEGMEIE